MTVYRSLNVFLKPLKNFPRRQQKKKKEYQRKKIILDFLSLHLFVHNIFFLNVALTVRLLCVKLFIFGVNNFNFFQKFPPFFFHFVSLYPGDYTNNIRCFAVIMVVQDHQNMSQLRKKLVRITVITIYNIKVFPSIIQFMDT